MPREKKENTVHLQISVAEIQIKADASSNLIQSNLILNNRTQSTTNWVGIHCVQANELSLQYWNWSCLRYSFVQQGKWNSIRELRLKSAAWLKFSTGPDNCICLEISTI